MKGADTGMSIAELTAKIEGLSPDDYNMVIMLVDRLSGRTGKGTYRINPEE